MNWSVEMVEVVRMTCECGQTGRHHHCGVSGFDPQRGDAPCPGCVEQRDPKTQGWWLTSVLGRERRGDGTGSS